MSRDSLSLYVTRGKRYSGIALAVVLLGLGATLAPGQEGPPGDMAQQAALASEQAYKLVQANKLDEARLAYQQIVTDYQQTDYAVWDSAIDAIQHIQAGDYPAADTIIEQLVQDNSSNPFIAKALNKIGDKYRTRNKHPKARELYRQVVTSWPQADYAIWAHKSLISENFKLKDDEAANTEITIFLTNCTV